MALRTLFTDFNITTNQILEGVFLSSSSFVTLSQTTTGSCTGVRLQMSFWDNSGAFICAMEPKSSKYLNIASSDTSEKFIKMEKVRVPTVGDSTASIISANPDLIVRDNTDPSFIFNKSYTITSNSTANTLTSTTDDLKRFAVGDTITITGVNSGTYTIDTLDFSGAPTHVIKVLENIVNNATSEVININQDSRYLPINTTPLASVPVKFSLDLVWDSIPANTVLNMNRTVLNRGPVVAPYIPGSGLRGGTTASNGDYNVVLSKYSFNSPSASDGTGYDITNAGGSLRVYRSSVDVTSDEFNITFLVSGTGIEIKNGLKMIIDFLGNWTITETSLNSWTSDTETFDIIITNKFDNTVVFNQSYTVSKAKQGIVEMGVLLSDEQFFKYDKDSILTSPGTINFTFNKGDLAGNVSWAVTSGTTDLNLLATGTTNSITEAGTLTTSATISATVGTFTDSITIPKLYDGEFAYSAYLTNEAHTEAADKTGKVVDTLYSGAGGDFIFFEGLTEITTGVAYSISGGVDNGTTWSLTKNNLILTINKTTGVYSLDQTNDTTSTWSTTKETFNLIATYKGTNHIKVYTITKAVAGLDASPAGESAQITVYLKAASAPVTPTNGGFNFDTNTIVAPTLPVAWSASIPAGTDTLYGSVAIASSTNGAGTDLVTWGSPNIVGSTGTSGTSVFQGTIFKRAASAPTTPVANSGSYNFSNNTLTPPVGWSASIPTVDGNPLYSTTATFSIIGATGTDSTQTWSFPVISSQDGTNGTNGTNGTTGKSTYQYSIYIRAASAPVTPTGGNFNFGTNAGTPPTGWSNTVPTVNGNPVYISNTLASIVGDTGIDSSLTWTTPSIMAQDGAPGSSGTNGSRGAGHFYGVVSSFDGNWDLGNTLESTQASAVCPGGVPVIDDVVTITNHATAPTVSETRIYSGTWDTFGKVVDGNLLVDGTVAANAITANSINSSRMNITDSLVAMGTSNLGNVTAADIVGGVIRTSTSGARVEIGNGTNLLSIIDAGNISNFSVNSFGAINIKAGALADGSIVLSDLSQGVIDQLNPNVSSATTTGGTRTVTDSICAQYNTIITEIHPTTNLTVLNSAAGDNPVISINFSNSATGNTTSVFTAPIWDLQLEKSTDGINWSSVIGCTWNGNHTGSSINGRSSAVPPYIALDGSYTLEVSASYTDTASPTGDVYYRVKTTRVSGSSGLNVPIVNTFSYSETLVVAGSYVHPNHSGDVVSVGDGAQTISANVVTAGKLNVTGNGTVGQYLESAGNGAFVWSTPSAGGTGDITNVIAGNGLTGGAISGAATVTLGSPGSCTGSTLNSVTTTSHTHAISLTAANVGALANTVTHDSISGFVLQEHIRWDLLGAEQIHSSRYSAGGTGDITNVIAGNGLTGGAISGAATVTMGTPGTCTGSTLNSVTFTSHTHVISSLDASDTSTGIFNIGRIPTGATGTTAALGNHTHTTTNVVTEGGGIKYLVYAGGTGQQQLGRDLALSYNPTTNILTTGGVSISSDIILKKNIKPYAGEHTIPTYTYDLKDGSSIGNIGYIYQDVVKQIPAATAKGEKYGSVNYIMVHTAKISELERKVEMLEDKLNKVMKWLQV